MIILARIYLTLPQGKLCIKHLPYQARTLRILAVSMRRPLLDYDGEFHQKTMQGKMVLVTMWQVKRGGELPDVVGPQRKAEVGGGGEGKEQGPQVDVALRVSRVLLQ